MNNTKKEEKKNIYIRRELCNEMHARSAPLGLRRVHFIARALAPG